MNLDERAYLIELAHARTKRHHPKARPVANAFGVFGKFDSNKHPRLHGKFTVKHGSGLVGKRSKNVSAVQSQLHGLGYNLGKFGKAGDGVDGRFGNFTERAVKSFQKDAGLKVDGIAGAHTLKALAHHGTRKRSR